jgi:hypothetical protein
MRKALHVLVPRTRRGLERLVGHVYAKISSSLVLSSPIKVSFMAPLLLFASDADTAEFVILYRKL